MLVTVAIRNSLCLANPELLRVLLNRYWSLSERCAPSGLTYSTPLHSAQSPEANISGVKPDPGHDTRCAYFFFAALTFAHLAL